MPKKIQKRMRICILNIRLGKLKIGQYRNVTKQELETLKRLTRQ